MTMLHRREGRASGGWNFHTRCGRVAWGLKTTNYHSCVTCRECQIAKKPPKAWQLLLHIGGTATASKQRFTAASAADDAANLLQAALWPFNEGEVETVAWAEVAPIAKDERDDEQAG